MGTKTTCDNPMCSCNPCTCDSCSCGVATLGDLERRVMDILWEEPEGERTVRSVADVLPEYAYTTVATVLERLSQKGLVRRRKVGRRGPVRGHRHPGRSHRRAHAGGAGREQRSRCRSDPVLGDPCPMPRPPSCVGPWTEPGPSQLDRLRARR